MAAKTTKSWYYEAKIVRSTSPVIVDRQGLIRAKWPLDALDGIVKMAREQWKVELKSIKLYDKVYSEETKSRSLELVATTKVGEPHEGSRRPSIIHQIAKESLLESPGEQLSATPFVDRPKLPALYKEEKNELTDNEAHWSGHVIGRPMQTPTYPLMKLT